VFQYCTPAPSDLADRDRHGYSILQEVAERTGGRVRLSPSTLYSAIGRLLAEGLRPRPTRRATRVDPVIALRQE
jgi:hypothetical protein